MLPLLILYRNGYYLTLLFWLFLCLFNYLKVKSNFVGTVHMALHDPGPSYLWLHPFPFFLNHAANILQCFGFSTLITLAVYPGTS